jgi:hypothetical protein
MSESFFSTIQGWVKSEFGPDYGGRYVGVLIQQVFTFDSTPFRNFFSEITGNALFQSKSVRIKSEEQFQVKAGARRADLVVYIDEEPKLLVELKYRDRLIKKSGTKPAQLTDYIELCRTLPSKPQFLLLHREPQRAEDISQIKRARQRMSHYLALASHLQRSSHPASALLLQYFREEGLVIEPIETNHLYRFFHRLILPPRGSGRINKTSEIVEGPLQFQRLLNNIRLIAADITPRLRTATGSNSTRAATVDFTVSNKYDATSVRKIMAGIKGTSFDIDGRARCGGIVDVWAQNVLPSSDGWLYLVYGIEFSLAKGKNLSADIYAGFLSPEIRKASDSDLWDHRCLCIETLPIRSLRATDKSDVDSTLVYLIRRAARSTLKSRIIRDRRKLSTLNRLKNL